jgi:hypothetical protein
VFYKPDQSPPLSRRSRALRRCGTVLPATALATAFVVAPAYAAETANPTPAHATIGAEPTNPPATANSATAQALSCQSQLTWIIGLGGPSSYSVRCSGNSASAYWATGACAVAGSQRGMTQFPPFLLPLPGPWSTISCPSGDYLISYKVSHG